MTTEQIAKIRKDLEVVQANMDVFAEIMNDLKPGHEKPADMELLEELNITCREMQNRIGELLSNVASDELTARMLLINDELNNLFLRYGRYKRNKEKTVQVQHETEPALIDFGTNEDNPVTQTFQKLDIRDEKASAIASRPSHITPEEDTALVLGHRQSDFDEMEAWLKANPSPAHGGVANDRN